MEVKTKLFNEDFIEMANNLPNQKKLIKQATMTPRAHTTDGSTT